MLFNIIMTIDQFVLKDQITIKYNGENGNKIKSQDNNLSSDISANDDMIDKYSLPLNFMAQLEQLSKTNVLKIRIKWQLNSGLWNHKKSWLINQLNELINLNKGIISNSSSIENYEYFADSKRLKVLGDNCDLYIFEHGSVDVFRSHEDSSINWTYDLIVQSKFKCWSDLLSVKILAKDLIAKYCPKFIDKWSIGENPSTLLYPGNLYIRGLPKNLKVEDLLPIFNKFGSVISLNLVCDGKTGEQLEYSFLSYSLGSSAALCIKKLNGRLMNGSPLYINYYVEKKEREQVYFNHLKEGDKFKSIFVGNLPLRDYSNKIIRPIDVIEKFREIMSSSIEIDNIIVSYYFPRISYNVDSLGNGDHMDVSKMNSDKLLLKGYGFINFTTYELALKSIELLNEYDWLGHKLVVNKPIHSRQKSNCPHFMKHTHLKNHHQKISRDANFNYMCYYPSHNLSSIPSPIMNSSQIISATHFPLYIFPLFQPNLDSNFIFNQKPTKNDFETLESRNIDDILQSYFFTEFYPDNPYMLPIPTKDQQESNLYIKHVPLYWKDDDLYNFYRRYGEIISAKIITVGGGKESAEMTDKAKDFVADDKIPVGTSKGYGFVCFKNPLDASRGIISTDRYKIDNNHTLYVSFAKKRIKSSNKVNENARSKISSVSDTL